MTCRALRITGVVAAAGRGAFAQDSPRIFIITTYRRSRSGHSGRLHNQLSLPRADVQHRLRASFNRRFQAEAGLQIALGAANNQNAEASDFGPVPPAATARRRSRIHGPLGGRFSIPNPFGRIDVSAGGGRGGYGLANARYFLNDSQNFSFGTALQLHQRASRRQHSGPLGTADHWVNLTFEFVEPLGRSPESRPPTRPPLRKRPPGKSGAGFPAARLVQAPAVCGEPSVEIHQRRLRLAAPPLGEEKGQQTPEEPHVTPLRRCWIDFVVRAGQERLLPGYRASPRASLPAVR